MTRLRVVCATAMALVVIAGSGLVAQQAVAGSVSPTWLTRLNAVRTDAGLARVTDSTAVVAAMKRHVTYLLHTPGHLRNGKYASVHTENPASRYYSASGARAAAHSDISSGSVADVDVVNGFLAAPFHALNLLDPRATQAALYRDPASGEAMLEVDVDSQEPLPTQAVRVPSALTTQTRGTSEHPDPTESCRHDTGASYSTSALPIIVMLPETPINPSATLTGPEGSTVSSHGNNLCLIYESHFYSTDNVYAPAGRSSLAVYHAVFIIARHPLVKGAYHVSLDYGASSPLTWTFHSAPAVQYPHLSELGANCSDTAASNGAVAVGLYDTPDSTPAATYHVRIGHTTHSVRLADGAAKRLVFTRFGAGAPEVHVTGPVAFTQPVTVPACAAWVAAQVRLTSFDPPHQRVSIVLDNRRNAHAVTFTVKDTGQRDARYTVRARTERVVRAVGFRYSTTHLSAVVSKHVIWRAAFGRS